MKQGYSTKFGRIITLAMLLVATMGNVISSFAQDVQEGAPTCTPPPAGLVGWWPAEGSAIDIAGNNNGTLSGSGATYAAGKVGQGFRFDGTNGFVQIPDSAALKPTNVTIEAWVWLDPTTTPGAGGESIIFKRNSWTFLFEGYSLLKQSVDNGNGTFTDRFSTVITRNGNQIILYSTTVAQRGVWYHVAATYDGNKLKLYVNGVVEASATAGFALDYGTLPVYIGTTGEPAPYNAKFGGIIDDPAIYNRALTTNEVAAIYTAGSAGKCGPTVASCATPPANLVAWWPGEGNGSDVTGINGGITQNIGFTNGKTGQAFIFNGSSSQIRVPASASLNVGLNQGLTVEAWINPANANLQDLCEWNMNSGSGAAPIGTHMYINESSGAGTLCGNLIDTNGTAHSFSSPPGTIVTNIFQHVAMTYDKASGLAALYRNGVMVATANFGVITPQTSFDFFMGNRPAGNFGGIHFAGVMDEVSVYKRALSQSEIQAIYAADSAGKCGPTVASCATPPANLVAWWPGEGNATDTAGTNNGTLVGATFVTGECGQSFNFNGANQKITIPDSDSLKLTNSLSIEGWIYPRANGFILFRGDSRPGLDPYVLSIETTHELQLGITSDAGQSAFLRTPGPLTMNQWAHVAATLDGASGTMRLYLNGTLAAETNTLLRPLRNLDPASSPGVAIGGHAGTYNYFSFDGIIDELSIYSRALATNEISAIYAASSAGKCFTPAVPSNLLVVPNYLKTNDMDFGSGTLVTSAFRNQQVYRSTEFPGQAIRIKEIRFRPDRSYGATFQTIVSNLQINLSTTTRAPYQLSSTYAQNTGTNDTMVFSGSIALSSQFTGPAAGPKDFDIAIPLQTPFIYNPALGNLLLDLRNFSGSSATLLSGGGGLPAGSRTFGPVNSGTATTVDGGIDALGIIYELVPTPPSITSQPASQTVVLNSSVNFSVLANGSAPLNYQWSFNNTNIANATNSILTISNVQLSAIGNYSVIVSNFVGIATSSNAVLTVTLPACTAPPSGLVSWWTAEGNANDSIGTNNGLMTNGATIAAGKVGQAFNFNGLGQFVKVPQSPTINSFGNQLTIEFWMRANPSNSMSGYQGLVATDHYGVEISNGQGGVIGLNFFADTGNGFFAVSSVNGGGIPVSAGVWHHVAGVYNGSKLQLFIDGQPAGNSANASGAITSMISTSYLSIGSDDGRTYCGCSGRYFWGLIDEPSIYNRALTTNEIATIYTAGSAGKCFTPALPFITQQPTNKSAVVGDSLTFSVNATGTDPLAYQWYFNNTLLNGKTNSSLGLTNVQLSQQGNYSVIVSNFVGIATSSNAVLTVTLPACTAPPSGLVSWWTAEGNALDSVGVNHGLNFGNVSYTPSQVGSAFNFNGSNFISIADAPALNPTNAITVEAWIFRKAVVGTWDPVVKKADNSQLNGYGLEFNNNNLAFWIYNNGWRSSGGSVPIALGKWYHVAGVYNGTRLMCFTNGVLAASFLTSGNITPAVNPLAIGNDPANSSSRFFNGMIDEVSIYNRALATNEIAAIYTAGSAGKCFTPAPPLITQQPTNQTITVGLPVTFSVAASGSAPISYQWQFNGNPIAGATNSIYAIAAAQTNQAGAYRVVVANLVGATNSTSATLTVVPLPQVPVITDFTPKSATNGAIVIVTGTNFSPVAANNIVYFGAVRAAVVSASANTLTISVPIGATHAPITVTVNGLVAYSGKLFQPTFFGNGLGISSSSFAPRLNLTAGNNPYRVLVGDIDGDGKPDLIVGNIFGTNISFYRNNSSGGPLTAASFAPRVDIKTPAGTYSPYGLTVGDVDGDGKLDVIASDYSANLISIYRNISSPGTISSNSFAARVDLTAGTQPQGVEVRDIDGDGRPDLLVVNGGNATLSIYRNTGVAGNITTNSFAPRVNITTGTGCTYMVIGDLNDDDRPDVVTANNGSSTLSVFRNLSSAGSITLNPKVDFTVPSGPVQMAIGDLDGDGKLDLTVASYLPQTFSVFRNISNGGLLASNSFAPRIDYSLGGRGHTPTIADLDGDGKPDIAVVTELNSVLSIFRHTSTAGSFTNTSLAARVDFSTGNNPWSVTTGDLDGDGRTDIILCNQNDSTLSIYQNQVPFAGPPVITLQPTNQTIVLGDNTSFNVIATGPQPFSYQWNFNGGAIAGATNNSLVLTDAQLSQAGDYSVTVANALGSVLSSNATLTVTVPVCTAPPTGLVSWWPGEASALDAASTNHGTLQAGITFATGKVGQAFVFNNTNAAVVVPASPNLNIGAGNGFTLEAWINPTDVAQAHALFEWNDSTWWGVHFFIAPGQPTYGSSGPAGPGQLYANIVDSSGDWHQLGSPGGVVASNVFQHVALTYDKTSGVAKIYCNGQVVSQTTLGSFTPLTTYNLYLGRRQAPSNEAGSFAGLMDEPSIYNRALTTNEIAAIYAARGAGKCPLQPTVLSVTPTNWYVNEGSTVSYTVTAVGSPVLTYQWQYGGFDIAGATNTTLILSNVVYAQAGNYAVVVSNPAGLTTSSNVVLRVNRAPVADASATDTLAISPNGTNAIVVLDGSLSSDPDGDPLTYAWFNFGDTNVLATSVVAITPLPVGTNQITLTVNDGMALNSQTIAIEVITTSQALDRLIALVKSGGGHTQPLIASLRAALAAIDRSQPATAINQLQAFINKVHAQIEPSDPALAAQLIADAQAIIDALNGGTSITLASVEITSLTPDHHGKAHLKIKGIKGRVHVIETSTNMVDWTPVGVAKQSADDSFEFDASDAQDTGARFYRVVSPK